MLLTLVFQQLLCFVCVLGYSYTPVQYHIQTDVGPDRYFRYQNFDGQYRKEKRLDDGTVFGTYGWVDPTGLLRLTDYVADTGGYRVVRTRKIQTKISPSANINSVQTSSNKYSKPVKIRNRKPIKVNVKKKLISPGTNNPFFPSSSNSISPNNLNLNKLSSSRFRKPISSSFISPSPSKHIKTNVIPSTFTKPSSSSTNPISSIRFSNPSSSSSFTKPTSSSSFTNPSSSNTFSNPSSSNFNNPISSSSSHSSTSNNQFSSFGLSTNNINSDNSHKSLPSTSSNFDNTNSISSSTYTKPIPFLSRIKPSNVNPIKPSLVRQRIPMRKPTNIFSQNKNPVPSTVFDSNSNKNVPSYQDPEKLQIINNQDSIRKQITNDQGSRTKQTTNHQDFITKPISNHQTPTFGQRQKETIQVKVKLPQSNSQVIPPNELRDLSIPEVSPIKKLKLRPLVIRRKKNPARLSLSRRRSNYQKVRQRVRNPEKLKPRQANFECCGDKAKLRGKTTIRRVFRPDNIISQSLAENNIAKRQLSEHQHRHEPQPITSESRITPQSRTILQPRTNNEPVAVSESQKSTSRDFPDNFLKDFASIEGRTTIDFDLGNQYRKEKIMVDGTVIGEHGYVDPMGILRATFYKSGSNGLEQKKKSYWVGSRSPRT